MARKIKIRAKVRKGIADIKCLVSHPMETGLRKDKKTGKKLPEHFIQDLTVAVNDKAIVNGSINTTVSTNPYFRFKAKANSGDKVTISWKDNMGESSSQSVNAK